MTFDIRDCSFAQLTRQPIFIEGWSAAAQVTDVTIANCAFENVAQPGMTITNAARINLFDNRGVELKWTPTTPKHQDSPFLDAAKNHPGALAGVEFFFAPFVTAAADRL